MIESVNRHLGACSKALRRHLSPSSSSPANVTAPQSTLHNGAVEAHQRQCRVSATERKSSWTCSSPVLLSRTKSDNGRNAQQSDKKTNSVPATTTVAISAMENGGDSHLNVPPSTPKKHHRSRSWDATACWASRGPSPFKMPLTQRLMSVGGSWGNRSSASSPNRSGGECVHCELQQLWNEMRKSECDIERKQSRTSLDSTGSCLRPDIVVSSSSCDDSNADLSSSISSSSSSSSSADDGCSESDVSSVKASGSVKGKSRFRLIPRKPKQKTLQQDYFTSASPTPPSSDHSPPLLSRFQSLTTHIARKTSVSDTDSADIPPPIIPSISVTEFFDSDRPPEFSFCSEHSGDDFDGNEGLTFRCHSVATMTPSETETVTPWPPSDGEDAGIKPAITAITPPPSPAAICQHHPNCPSGFLDADTSHLRSSSVDLPSLKYCIEKSTDDVLEDARTLRSHSVDLSAIAERIMRPRSPVATARVFTSILRKAITRSPLPLARTNAQLDLFANLNKERAARYWSETAAAGEHIWIGTGASTECYIGEMDCSKTGDKVKCAACHVVVHEGCLQLLRRMNFNCKLAYREAQTSKFQKEQPFIVHHHWVHKWRQEGRCKACGKSFQSKFLNKELVSIACSWCKAAYHNKHGCFTMKQIEEACTMGPLKDVIIPPSWVFKLPPRRISTIRKRHISNNFSSKRKKRSKKTPSDRLFVVKPQPPLEASPRCPILIFVNPKSGGNKGAKILHTLQWLVNPRQVFDVAAMSGPRYGLEMYRKLLPRLRVLVCGGDGTVGWVLSTLDALKWPVYPAIGIVPLGTGNDLARTLGWGATYADEPVSEVLIAVSEETVVSQLDRWSLQLTPNTDAEWDVEIDDGTVKELPLSVMNNYFSIGADAHVALQFHESRSANPDVFNSRLKNRLFYGGIGTMDLFKRTWKDLSEHISLYCDGVDMTWRVQELKLHCLLFLNIPRYAGGTLPWGAVQAAAVGGTANAPNTNAFGPQQQSSAAAGTAGQNSPTYSPQFSPPSYSDGKVEVLGFTSATLAALQVGGRGERIAQCSEVKIVTRKVIPAQVDGEPCKLAPSIITMRFHSKVPMLQRLSCKSNSRRGSCQTQLTLADPADTSGMPALHTSVLLRLPVAVMTKADYDSYKQDTVHLRTAAVYLGDITVESETDLDQVRGIVQRLLADRREYFPAQNITEWSFLDYVSNDNVFRLSQSQESFQSVSDICQIDDVLLIVHSGFRRPAVPTVNGEDDSSRKTCTNPSDEKSLLQHIPEAMRITFTSDEAETKI